MYYSNVKKQYSKTKKRRNFQHEEVNLNTKKYSTQRHEDTKTQRREFEHKKKNLNTKALKHEDCLHNYLIISI